MTNLVATINAPFGTAQGILVPNLASDPASPSVGQIWYNTGAQELKVWTSAGVLILAGASAPPTSPIQLLPADPSSPFAGDLWYNTTTNQLKLYNGTATVIIADLSTTQTLTSKTLTAPVISSPSLSGVSTGTFTLGGAVTENSPTINTPTISSPILSGTATGSYTLAGAPTLTSPTINSPTINTPQISGNISGNYNLGGTPSISNATITSATISASTISSPALSGTATGTYTLGGNPTINNPSISSPVISGNLSGTFNSNGGTFNGPTINGPNLSLASSTSDPASPVAGQLYYNSTTQLLRYFTGSAWISLTTSSPTNYPGPDLLTLDSNGPGGTLEVGAGGISNKQLAANAVQPQNIQPGSNGQVLTTISGTTQWGNTGSVYPGPDNNTINTGGAGGTLQVAIDNNTIVVSSAKVQVPIDNSSIKMVNGKMTASVNSGGYPGIDNATIVQTGGNGVLKVPIDNSTIKLVSGTLQAAGTSVSGATFGDYDVLVQTNTNGQGTSQPLVVNNLGVALVNANGAIQDTTRCGTGNNGNTATAGIQEGLNYLSYISKHPPLSGASANPLAPTQGKMAIGTGTFNVNTTILVPCTSIGIGTPNNINYPIGASGLTVVGSGFGDPSQQGGTVIQASSTFSPLVKDGITYPGLISLGNVNPQTGTSGTKYGTGHDQSQAGIVCGKMGGSFWSNIAWFSNGKSFSTNNANGINTLVDFFNCDDGSTKGGMRYDQFSFFGGGGAWGMDASHTDDGQLFNMVFNTGSQGMYYVSSSGSCKFYNGRFFAQIFVNTQQALFCDCVFGPTLQVQAPNDWQQLEFIGCYWNPGNSNGSIQLVGNTTSTKACFINMNGCHLGTSSGNWFTVQNTGASTSNFNIVAETLALRNHTLDSNGNPIVANVMGTHAGRIDFINITATNGSAGPIAIAVGGTQYTTKNTPLQGPGWQNTVAV